MRSKIDLLTKSCAFYFSESFLMLTKLSFVRTKKLVFEKNRFQVSSTWKIIGGPAKIENRMFTEIDAR